MDYRIKYHSARKRNNRPHHYKSENNERREVRDKPRFYIRDKNHRNKHRDGNYGKDNRDKSKETERFIVFPEFYYGLQYFYPVGNGIEFRFGALRSVAITDDDVLDRHIFIDRMNRHFGLYLKSS